MYGYRWIWWRFMYYPDYYRGDTIIDASIRWHHLALGLWWGIPRKSKGLS